MAEQYHLLIDGKQVGPYEFDYIRFLWLDGKLSSKSMYWKDGMPEWQSIANIIGQMAPTTPREPQPATRKTQGSSSDPLSVVGGIIGFLIGLVFIGFIVKKTYDSAEASEAGPRPVPTFESTPAPVSTEAPKPFGADGLYAEYRDNEVAADQRWKEHRVQLWGRVQQIGKDIVGDPYVIIGGTSELDGCQCSFPRSTEGALANLSKGQMVTIVGTVSGLMGNVQVRDCSLQ